MLNRRVEILNLTKTQKWKLILIYNKVFYYSSILLYFSNVHDGYYLFSRIYIFLYFSLIYNIINIFIITIYLIYI